MQIKDKKNYKIYKSNIFFNIRKFKVLSKKIRNELKFMSLFFTSFLPIGFDGDII